MGILVKDQGSGEGAVDVITGQATPEASARSAETAHPDDDIAQRAGELAGSAALVMDPSTGTVVPREAYQQDVVGAPSGERPAHTRY